MKDVIRSAPVRALGTNRDIAAAAGWHVLTAVAGLVASHAVIADRLIPFGLSFAAGIPAAFAPSAAVGAFLGYLVSPLENGNFRYIAGVLGVIALRLFASLSEKISKNRLLPAAICLFSSLLTSFFTMRLFDSSVTDIFAEAFFAAGGAYFISGFFREYYENPAGLGTGGAVSLFCNRAIVSFI